MQIIVCGMVETVPRQERVMWWAVLWTECKVWTETTVVVVVVVVVIVIVIIVVIIVVVVIVVIIIIIIIIIIVIVVVVVWRANGNDLLISVAVSSVWCPNSELRCCRYFRQSCGIFVSKSDIYTSIKPLSVCYETCQWDTHSADADWSVCNMHVFW